MGESRCITNSSYEIGLNEGWYVMELLIVVDQLNEVMYTSKHKKMIISNSICTFRFVNEMKPFLIFSIDILF